MIEQHNSLAEKFLRKWFWLYLFSFIIAPIWYIIKIIISWELEVYEVWIIYWVISLMTLVSSFNDLWMAESLNKFLPDFITQKRYDKVKTLVLYAILAQAITWGIIFCVFYFWANFLAQEFFKDSKSVEVIQIFAYYFLANTFYHVLNVFFQAVQDTFSQKITELFRMMTILIFIFWVFILDMWSLHTYSYSWVLWMYIWMFIAMIMFFKKYYKKYLSWVKFHFDKELFKQIFKYALLVFLWAQAGTILSQIDMQMIIYFLWNTDAWYYTNYLSVIWIPFLIFGPIFWLLFPIFSEMNAKKETEKIKVVKKVFTKNFLVFSIVISILFFVFWQIMSTILFWEKFLTSWIILQYSILFLPFNFLLQVNFNIFAAIGQVKERLNIIIIAIIFNTILNYVLIKTIWVSGAALATWCGWFLIWILSEIKLKNYRVWYDFKYIFLNSAIFSILWVFMYYEIVPLFHSMTNKFYEFLFLCLISFIYFIIFFIINFKEFKYFLSEIKNVRKNW